MQVFVPTENIVFTFTGHGSECMASPSSHHEMSLSHVMSPRPQLCGPTPSPCLSASGYFSDPATTTCFQARRDAYRHPNRSTAQFPQQESQKFLPDQGKVLISGHTDRSSACFASEPSTNPVRLFDGFDLQPSGVEDLQFFQAGNVSDHRSAINMLHNESFVIDDVAHSSLVGTWSTPQDFFKPQLNHSENAFGEQSLNIGCEQIASEPLFPLGDQLMPSDLDAVQRSLTPGSSGVLHPGHGAQFLFGSNFDPFPPVPNNPGVNFSSYPVPRACELFPRSNSYLDPCGLYR